MTFLNMADFNPRSLKKLYVPTAGSHKGQNGKVMVIGGSKLFHAASLWALEIASHIVDMVYYASVTENNQVIKESKQQFRNGIVVPRDKIESYIAEADSILIGPGLPRSDGQESGDDDTRALTETLLRAYPHKHWVIDGGSLQTMDPNLIPPEAILTPHPKEFEMLFKDPSVHMSEDKQTLVHDKAKQYNCTIILKGEADIIASPSEITTIAGGNAGLTKGGTGDVLAGLAAALYAKNDAWISATAASYFNKAAAMSLFKSKGYWYNTSELVTAIPTVMKEIVL